MQYHPEEQWVQEQAGVREEAERLVGIIHPTVETKAQKFLVEQYFAIARALVSHPKIVLADEPTTALDKKSGRDVVEIMYNLAKQQGCTILLVAHDNRTLDIADRIIYMEDGGLSKAPELSEKT